LIIAHEPNAQELWTAFYEDKKLGIHTGEIIKIPAYKITNELDKWILAALHQMGKELEQHMDYYLLDNAAKVVLGFVDKLNNRYIRRSRRRFRATGMDGDKFSAYSTLLEVLETYLKFVAPFAPFISEHLFLEIQKNFKKTSEI
jgi:isoleucyl-tRNA synthetase